MAHPEMQTVNRIANTALVRILLWKIIVTVLCIRQFTSGQRYSRMLISAAFYGNKKRKLHNSPASISKIL